mmetsp:Transcript_23613/g.56582  ORF Transcript_23613/g.56582 Transcript_23613/m.56582 type:complete len:217 (-) Transcript_23613:327-977(-)
MAQSGGVEEVEIRLSKDGKRTAKVRVRRDELGRRMWNVEGLYRAACTKGTAQAAQWSPEMSSAALHGPVATASQESFGWKRVVCFEMDKEPWCPTCCVGAVLHHLSSLTADKKVKRQLSDIVSFFGSCDSPAGEGTGGGGVAELPVCILESRDRGDWKSMLQEVALESGLKMVQGGDEEVDSRPRLSWLYRPSRAHPTPGRQDLVHFVTSHAGTCG